jgi:hypothetical protein
VVIVKDGKYLKEADVLFEAYADVNACNKERVLQFISLSSNYIPIKCVPSVLNNRMVSQLYI